MKNKTGVLLERLMRNIMRSPDTTNVDCHFRYSVIFLTQY